MKRYAVTVRVVANTDSKEALGRLVRDGILAFATEHNNPIAPAILSVTVQEI